MIYAEPGSISSATMRPEDLIPCFLDELGVLAKANENKEDLAFVEEVIERREEMCKNDEFSYEEYYDSESASYDLEELFDRLKVMLYHTFTLALTPAMGRIMGSGYVKTFSMTLKGNKFPIYRRLQKKIMDKKFCMLMTMGILHFTLAMTRGNLRRFGHWFEV